MSKKLTLGLALTAVVLTAAIASAQFFRFDDVPDDVWYTEAVYSMHNKNIIEGYADNTFKPQNDVTRAELAVMLDRLITFLTLPSGEESWVSYTSNPQGYSIHYPNNWGMMELDNGGIMVRPPDMFEDYLWSVNVYDAAETSIRNLSESTLDQFDTFISTDTFILNGVEVTHVIVTTAARPSLYSETIYVEGNGKIYVIGNGAIKRADFELFYRSFKLI